MSRLIWLPWMTCSSGHRCPGGDEMHAFVASGGGFEIVNPDGSGDDGRRALVRVFGVSGRARRRDLRPAELEAMATAGGRDTKEACAEGVTVAEHRAGVGPRGGR